MSCVLNHSQFLIRTHDFHMLQYYKQKTLEIRNMASMKKRYSLHGGHYYIHGSMVGATVEDCNNLRRTYLT